MQIASLQLQEIRRQIAALEAQPSTWKTRDRLRELRREALELQGQIEAVSTGRPEAS